MKEMSKGNENRAPGTNTALANTGETAKREGRANGLVGSGSPGGGEKQICGVRGNACPAYLLYVPERLEIARTNPGSPAGGGQGRHRRRLLAPFGCLLVAVS